MKMIHSCGTIDGKSDDRNLSVVLMINSNSK